MNLFHPQNTGRLLLPGLLKLALTTAIPSRIEPFHGRVKTNARMPNLHRNRTRPFRNCLGRTAMMHRVRYSRLSVTHSRMSFFALSRGFDWIRVGYDDSPRLALVAVHAGRPGGPVV